MEAPASQAQHPRLQDYGLLHFIVLLWGFTALLGMALAPLTPNEVVFWRTLAAALAMWILFGRRISRQPIGAPRLWAMLGTGTLIAIHWWLFFLAARVGNVSSCLAGIATGSVWTALLEPVVDRRRIRWADLATAVVVCLGLLVIFAGQADKAWGVAIGIASALFSSLFGLCNRYFVQSGSDVFAISTVGLSGAFVTTAFMLPLSAWAGFQSTVWPALPQGSAWLWLFLLSGVCTVFALTASVALLRRFSAFSTSLAINMEPVYGILAARLLLGQAEAMTPAFYIGTAVILLAVLGHPLLLARQKA